MEKTKQKCLWCEKQFIQKKWVKRSGMLKGFNMVSSVCCSRGCSNKLKNSLKLASAIEDLEEQKETLQKKFNKLFDSRKR
jgi:outer membrane murein-binding lipoprotein Lpp